jgi:peptidoglycan/xylan/chitin deacetylase (PgdA/CDA1 family)
MSGLRLTISVDDGHPLDLRVADLLDRHGLQATFYVPVVNDEGPPVMTAAQVRQLAQRFEIGSHTRSHRFLTTLDDAPARSQVVDGKHALEEWLGAPVQGFCYPGGRYWRRHVAMVRAAGFAYARTTQNLRLDAGSHPYRMPTTLQFYPHPRSVLARNLLSQGDPLTRLPGFMTAMSCRDWLERSYRLLAVAAARSGVFHLWLHTLDLERLGLWTALDCFLARAAERVPPASCLTNGRLAGDLAACPDASISCVPVAQPPAAAARPRAVSPRLLADRPAAAHPSTPSENNAT